MADTCPDHGTWYDRRELLAIAKAVAAERRQPMPDLRAVAPSPKGAATVDHEDHGSGGGLTASSLEGVVKLLAGTVELVAAIFGGADARKAESHFR